MTNLRRTVRKAIQGGTTMYAVVESYNLGLSTVRLAGVGTRLSNLSTIGGEMEPGDNVIVDYSAGTPPFVRPAWIPEYIEPPLPETKALEGNPLPDDWGVYACVVYNTGQYEPDYIPGDNDHGDGTQWIRGDTPTIMWIADSDLIVAEDTCEFYDCAVGNQGMFDETQMWTNGLTIQRGGMYIISLWVTFVNLHGQCNFDSESQPLTLNGEPYYQEHYRGEVSISILKNGTALCKENLRTVNGRYQSYSSSAHPCITAIESCAVGDLLQAQIYQDNMEYWYNDGWGFPGYLYDTMVGFKAHLIPHTDT